MLSKEVEEQFRDYVENSTDGEGEYIYEKQLHNLVNLETPHIDIDFFNLYNYNPSLAEVIREDFYNKRPIIDAVIRDKLRVYAPIYLDSKLFEVRVVNLPTNTKIHEVDANMIGELVQIEGTVIQRGKPLVKVDMLEFKCVKCGYGTKVRQIAQYRVKPQEECPNCEGRKWRHEYDDSTFIDYQEIQIQELTENTPQGKNPEKIKIVLTRGLIRSCEAGETVTIVGVLEAYDKSPRSMSLEIDYQFYANSLVNKTESSTIELSEEDKKQIQEWMRDPRHLERVIQSYAPTIYGLDHVKEALAYQQCEGLTKIYKTKDEEKNEVNYTTKRGQFHILLTGSPGLGKSELGEYSAKYHVKGRTAMGKGASAVGLTASVVKEDDGWVLKAGAMVLADNGLLFIDEIEKMRKEDSGAMHPGMEQQVIHINKAGIDAKINTRCSVLATCNPLTGQWDNYKTLVDNLYDGSKGLPIPLINRFALIYVVRNSQTSDEEREVAHHITRVMSGKELDIFYSFEDLRKIFAYARTVKPSIPEHVMERVKDFYMILYEASKAEGTMVFSRRQIEDLVRITEASAKLHGRSEANLQDCNNAIRVVSQSVKEYGIDPSTGKIDMNIIYQGEPKSKSDRLQKLPTIIYDLSRHSLGGDLLKDDLLEHLETKWEVSKDEIEELLRCLQRDNVMYYPRPGVVKLV